MGIVAYLQMQVGGPALHGDAQQIINIHSTLPPNNLPYDEPKSHWAQDDLSNGKGRGRDRPFWAGGSGRGTFQPARKSEPVLFARYRSCWVWASCARLPGRGRPGLGASYTPTGCLLPTATGVSHWYLSGFSPLTIA